eukprot:SAG22_NODE_19351_length_275_cov_33.034091_1_plen_33_part_10
MHRAGRVSQRQLLLSIDETHIGWMRQAHQCQTK